MENKLKFSYLLNPILLKMFDGSTPSNVSKKVWMLITFSTGETHHLELFVTSLDENYSLILGYDWLAQHNPSIDWTETKITFRESKNPKEKLASGEKIDIHMVSALTMTKLCKDPGTPAFMISMANLIPSQATAANTLDSILAEYHDFCDVFSGEKVGTLAPHPMTSKSMSKKVQTPFTDQSTPCPPQNSRPCGNSSRSIPGGDSSAQVSLHGAPPSYSSRRKMAASTYAWTSAP